MTADIIFHKSKLLSIMHKHVNLGQKLGPFAAVSEVADVYVSQGSVAKL